MEKEVIVSGQTGLQLNTLESMWRFAQYVATSGLAPKSYVTPEQVLIGIQAGAELGLTPMKSLASIKVVNGIASVWGDMMLAIPMRSGQMDWIREGFEVAGKPVDKPKSYSDDTAAVCTVKRKGQEPVRSSFSVADAKRASLWGKQGPWAQYPERMLKARARSFALRDVFPDVLAGFMSTEEAHDVEVDVTPPPVARPIFIEPTPESTEPQPESNEPSLGDLMGEAGIGFDSVKDWIRSNAKTIKPEMVDAWETPQDIPEGTSKIIIKNLGRIAEAVNGGAR